MKKYYLAMIMAALIILGGISVAQDKDYVPIAEIMPAPKGGYESIYKRISYPELAKRNKISGKVYLLVFIDEQGNVNDIQVIKGLGSGCDEAAMNGVKGAKFEPGKNGGTPVKVKLSMAINFKGN